MPCSYVYKLVIDNIFDFIIAYAKNCDEFLFLRTHSSE